MFKSFPNKSVSIAVLALTICALASISVARADPIIVGSEADFLAAVGDVEREGFEAIPTDLCSTGGSSPSTTITTSLLTVTTNPQGGGTSFLCIGTTVAGFPGPTEGSNALIAGSNTGDPWILSFVLTEAVNGVYFELTDAVERGDAFISIEGMDNILVASQGSGGLITVFFGIITNDPFTQFSLINTGISDGWGVDNMILAQVSESVTIDIKPGSDPVCNGAIPVAILGSVTLDVIQIDQTTLSFEGLDIRERGNGALSCNIRDTNRDGFADLVCQYQDTTTEGTLTGELLDGTPIEGADTFCVVH